LADHIETQNYGNSELMLGFQRGGVVADEDKFNYIIIAAAEDDIVRVLREKKVQLKRPPPFQRTNVWI